MRLCKYQPSARAGTTILEVLFAIFVVIVGLLGIASIIPLAARNAVESNAHNNAQSLGPTWLNSFVGRGLNNSNAFEDKGQGYNWVWLQDYGTNQGYRPFRKLYVDGTERTRIEIQAPLNVSRTYSSVTASEGVRIWGYQSVCIDPTFFTEPDVRQRIQAGFSRIQGYRAAVFPYFDDGFNPVTDPAQPSDPWHDQPRMLRVSLGTGVSLSQTIVSRKLVDGMFSSSDDLPISTYSQDVATGEQIVDETIPATRLFQSLANGLQKSIPNSEYTWLITASPEEPRSLPGTQAELNATTRDYTVTMVVIHRRDKQFIDPNLTPTPGSVEDKPAGERLVWVVPLSGNFSNGNGGRVRLIANAATEDSVHIGDWIMLGKHYLINPAIPAQRYSYFRWYRIVAVDQEKREDFLSNISPSGTDPYDNAAGQTVWSRDVVLEGPDFDLSFRASNTVNNVPDIPTPTTGTLVEGVVTVLERRLTIQ
jgi:hypothetical protein